jgi:hypothetical protein
MRVAAELLYFIFPYGLLERFLFILCDRRFFEAVPEGIGLMMRQIYANLFRLVYLLD